MASLRVVPNGFRLYRGLVPLVRDGQLVLQREGRDVARVTLSAEEWDAIANRPAPTPEPSLTGTRLGIVGTPDWPPMTRKAVEAVRPYYVRLDTARMREWQERDAAVQGVLSLGAHPIVLLSDWTASGVAQLAREFAGRYSGEHIVFEVGNEDSYAYKNGSSPEAMAVKAQQYARKVKEIAQAVEFVPHVEVIAQADNALWAGSTWVDGCYRAVPDLHRYAQGWVIHPYTAGREAERIRLLVAQTVAHGAPREHPIWITEWGIATDDGRALDDNYGHPRNLTYAQTASRIRAIYKGLVEEFPQLAAFVYYTNIDQQPPGASSSREAYFGVLARDGTPKPYVAEAVRALGTR